MTFFEAITEYWNFAKLQVKGLTAERYLTDVRLLAIYLHNPTIYKVKDKDIVSYLQTLLEADIKYNTVVKKCFALKSFFNYAYKKGWITFSPELIPRMRAEPQPPRVATEEEYQKILAAIDKKKGHYYHVRNEALIRLLWDTGARNGEICSLNVGDLDLEKMKAVVKTEKSRGLKPFREIYWTKDTNEVLQKWLLKREKWATDEGFTDPQALFVGSSNEARGKRLTNSAVDILLRKYANKAGLARFNPHSMRHHFGHILAAEKKANNSIISSLMGHSNLASSYVYTELNNQEREKAYRKFFKK